MEMRFIASHRRITGKQKYSLDITHYIKTFHRKPGALANSKVLAQADELIQNMFNSIIEMILRNFCRFLI